MTLLLWGRILLIGGLAAAVLSAGPALILAMLPPGFSDGLAGIVAALLTLSVTPLALAAASVGAALLLLWAVRRGRS